MLVDVLVGGVEKNTVPVGKEVLIDVPVDEVVADTYSDDELEPNKCSERDGEFFSLTDDNDLEWGRANMS